MLGHCSQSISPEELARHVGGAPCVAHAAAVASSALGSLLKGRSEEAILGENHDEAISKASILACKAYVRGYTKFGQTKGTVPPF